MPIYEYQCKKCGVVFEKIQRFSDEPLKVHENCGGSVKRLLSPPALQFKGSGFYITDYAKGHSNGANGSTKRETKSETPATAPKSETSGSKNTATSTGSTSAPSA